MDAKPIECIRSTASASRFGARSSVQITGFRSIERCGANGPPSRTPVGRYGLTSLAIDIVFSFKKEGEHRPRSGRIAFPTRDTFAPDDTKTLDITRVAAHEKEKALDPCELRASLHDAPRCHARGMAEGSSPGPAGSCDPTTPLCSGATPSAQPYVACRDEIGIASDRF